jgi:hypothetical protein
MAAAAAVFVLLAVFGITATMRMRKRWYLWAAAAGFCDIFSCVLAKIPYSLPMPFSWVWLAVLLAFASHLYLTGQKRPRGVLAVPGLLIMAFSLLTIVEWLIVQFFGGYGVYLGYFFSAFHAYYFDSYYYGSDYGYDRLSYVFVAAALMASLAFVLLGTKLRGIRYNLMAVVAAWVIGATLLVSGVFPNTFLALAIFLLLTVFGVAAMISARRAWAFCACAAGLLGAIGWIAHYDLPRMGLQICFVAWCALMFMVGFFLYRSREGTPDSGAEQPMAPPNEQVDNRGPTMYCPQWGVVPGPN